jgi:hypothetical protein
MTAKARVTPAVRHPAPAVTARRRDDDIRDVAQAHVADMKTS